MKKRITALLLCLVMALSLIPTTVWAASNSTVVLHPSVGSTVTGVKVKVGDTIDGHPITSISGYDITVDLGKYNVNNDTFRLPYATAIWEGVDNNKVDYISWAGSGSNRRSEGANALLANGKNTAYYYFKGEPVLPTFTLNYDANGGTGAPASQTYKATSQSENSHTFTISLQTPTREGYTFLGWSTKSNATSASYQPGGSIVVTGTTTLYAVWEEKTPPTPDKPTAPGEDDLIDLIGDITVNCTNDKASHTPTSKGYALIAGSYTTSEVEVDAENGYTYTVTINSQKYVEQFDTDTGAVHTPKNAQATVTLKYTDNGWTVDSGTPVVFTVVCEEEKPDDPTKPSPDDVKKLLTQDIRVVDDTGLHAEKNYKLKDVADSSFTIGEVTIKDGQFVCPVTIKFQPFVDKYSKDVGKTHTLKGSQTETVVELVARYDEATKTWTWAAAKADRYATIHVECAIPDAPTAKDLKDLGVTVDVDCKAVKHTAKDYGLTGNETLTVTKKEANGVWTATVSLSDDSAKAFLKQYSKDIGESHTELLTNGTIDLVFKDGAWKLADAKKNVLNITTNCSTTGGNTNPGTTPGTRRPYTKAETKTVESGKTFDAGIAMYVGLSILSVTGSAVVIRKRKDF